MKETMAFLVQVRLEGPVGGSIHGGGPITDMTLIHLGHCTNCAHAVSIIGYFPPGHTHSVTLAGIALSSAAVCGCAAAHSAVAGRS